MSTTAAPVRRFSRYEIVRKLGRSMTDVYLAFDPRINRHIILKVIERVNDDFTRLVIEAEKRGAQIQRDLHRLDPRILEIYDCGEAEGSFFVAMEYFEGRNISEILVRERRIEPKQAAVYGAEICSQLDRLHSFVSDVDGKKRAVVHGDIKPSNVQIGPAGEVRLLDFGIAKVITYTRSLTQHNLGSPTYCSPERLAKGQVDAQSDLWALGVTLYEMVAGSPPYQAQDTRKLENLIQSGRPPRSLPPTCPAPLRAIVNKALAPEIGRRYASAAEFGADLRAFVEDRPTAAIAETKPAWGSNTTVQHLETRLNRPPVPSPRLAWARGAARALSPLRRINWLRLVSVLLVVLCIFLAFYLFGRMRDQVRQARAPIDLTRATVVEINAAWQRVQALKDKDAFLGRLSPGLLQQEALRQALIRAADDVIEDYRDSSEGAIESFDWYRAQVCLGYALQITPEDRTLLGKAALVDAFLNLSQNPTLPKAAQSEAGFRRAAGLLPKSPEPHLGLARLYIYSFNSVGRAMAELHQAERLGFKLGPREGEEEGDGYVLRAEGELKDARKQAPSSTERARNLRLAQGDLDRARDFYEPIIGFSRVDEDLRRLDQDSAGLERLKSPPPEKPRAAPARKKAVRRRWR